MTEKPPRRPSPSSSSSQSPSPSEGAPPKGPSSRRNSEKGHHPGPRTESKLEPRVQPGKIRLNKAIADSGLCSRRKADALIEQGQVKVNGQVVTDFYTFVDPERDKVLVHERPLPHHPKRVILFHKPKGVVTTRSDERGRKTIYDCLPEKYQVLDPVGRLDRDSTGALLMSNDGDFLHWMMHPSHHVEKVYRVELVEKLKSPDVVARQLVVGVKLPPEGLMATAVSVEVLDGHTLIMVLVTGVNRQIRRSLKVLGYTIKKLHRTTIGPLPLGNLKPGQCRELTEGEIKLLRQAAQPKSPHSTY